jgi:dTMP kinase
MRKNPFIVLEGLSAVGKTTIAKKLALKIGGYYFNTPGKEYGVIRDYVDKNVSIEARYLFYLSSVIASSEQIEILLESTPVVCDRYLYTTTCWHKAMGVKIEVNDFFESNIILKPDFNLLITCEDSIRLKRMKERGISYYDNFEMLSGVDQNFLKFYKECDMVLFDNTDDNDIDDVVEKIASLITI